MLRASKLWVYLVRAWENSLYRLPRTAPKYTEIVPETANHHSKHTHKHSNVKYIYNDTALYLLNRMLHCYNSCTTLKPKHHYLVSDFNIGPNILHTLLQPEKQTKHFKKSRWRVAELFLNVLFPFTKCSWFWLVDILFGPTPHKGITWREIRTFNHISQHFSKVKARKHFH